MNHLLKQNFDYLLNLQYISMMQQVERQVWTHCVPDKETSPGEKLNTRNHHVLCVEINKTGQSGPLTPGSHTLSPHVL